MRRVAFYIISTLISFEALQAQWVKEDDTTRIWLNDGIYVSDTSFFNNNPDFLWEDFKEDNWRKKDSLERKRIGVGIRISDYYNGNIRLKTRGVYGIDSSGIGKVIPTNNIFAISVLGTPYLHVKESMNENFVKVSMQGVISFVGYYRKIPDPFSVSAGTLYNEPRETSEYVEKIVDFEAGEMVRKKRTNLELILKRDSSLYQQFNSGKRSYQNVLKSIDRYNSKHRFKFK